MLLGGCASRSTVSPASRAVGSAAITIESIDERLAAAVMAERLAPSAAAHLGVAEEYFRLGILDAAQARVTIALTKNPRFAAAHEMMARVWRDWGQPEAALVHAYRAIHFAQDSSSAHNTLGTILDALERLNEARASYLRSFALDRTASWALSNLCYLEFRQGRFDEARRHCEAALAVTPELTEARNNLGLTFAAAGDLDRAHDAFLAAADVATAQYNLGIVHLAAGRNDAALRAFTAAIEARPGFTAAKTRAHEARMRAIRGVDRN